MRTTKEAVKTLAVKLKPYSTAIVNNFSKNCSSRQSGEEREEEIKDPQELGHHSSSLTTITTRVNISATVAVYVQTEESVN